MKQPDKTPAEGKIGRRVREKAREGHGRAGVGGLKINTKRKYPKGKWKYGTGGTKPGRRAERNGRGSQGEKVALSLRKKGKEWKVDT